MTEALAILGFTLVCVASYWVQLWVESESDDVCESGREACGRCAQSCERHPGAGHGAA